MGKRKRSAGGAAQSGEPTARRVGRGPAPTRFASGLAVLGCLAAGVYANALGNGFVWDDPIIVERQLVVFDSLGDVLVTPRGIPNYSPDYYRPTTTVSYLVDRALGGDDPLVFHLSVILAHAAATVLIALLCRQLLGASPPHDRASLLAAALFAVHPVHTESVAWAAGRSDVLATLFLVAVLLLLGMRRPGPTRLAASALCAFAALGAKEVALTLVPLIVLRDWLDPEIGLGRAAARRYAGVAIAVVAYLLLRRLTIGEVVGEQPGEGSVLSVLPEMFWALGGYVRELLWPLPLNAYIDAVPRGPGPVLGLAALAAALAWVALRWRRRRDLWPELYAALWIPLTVAPSLAILWKIPEVPMAERYAYLPSVGLSLGVAAALARSGIAARRWLPLAAIPVLGLAAAAVWARNPVWRDDIRLWTDTSRHTRVSGMAWRSLGAAYLRTGRDDEAEAPLRRALELRNTPLGLQGIYSNLGTIEMRRRRFAEARRLYEQALERGADGADVAFNLGLSIFYGGEQNEAAARQALPHFERAALMNPYDPDVDAVLGQTYATLGDVARARAHLRAALDKGVRPETRSGVEELLRRLSDGS